MGTRTERIILELDDHLTPGLAGAAAKVRAVDNALDDMSTSSRRADSSINQLTGRLRLVADVAAMLGPALVPIGGVALAGVAGLANQLGAAALAGGTALVAFQGFGDGLEALNKAQLEPTAENIAAAREALADLSPAAQEAVVAVDNLIPALKGVRDAAAEGLMPGFVEGLENIDPLLDRASDLVQTMGSAMGDVFAGAVESLGSERWADFFDFLGREGPATFRDLSAIVGDLTHGLSEMWEAFGPLNADFSDWMVGVADSFDGWAQGLSQTEGFRDFIAYVRESGPQVAETFGALGNALVQVAEAAAPLGGPALAAIEAVADLAAGIAGSDAGSALLALAAGMAALGRVQQLSARFTGKANPLVAISDGATKASTNLRAMRADVGTLATTWATAGAKSQREATRMAAASDRLKSSMRGIAGAGGPAAGAIGLFALSSTDLDEQLGLANAAMGTMAGLMVGGPWGAAVGFGIGALADLTSVTGDASDAITDMQRALSGGDIATATAGLDAVAAAAGKVEAVAFGLSSIPGGALVNKLFGLGDQSDASAAVDDLEAMELALGHVGEAMGAFDSADGRSMVPTLTQLQEVAERSAPAMEALGISFDDLRNASPDELRGMADAIVGWNSHADSAAGRTDALAGAMADLDNGLLSTADSASQLSAALEGLLGPGLNASEATDAFEGSLRNLEDEIAKNSRALTGFSDGALQNREAFRGLTVDATNMLTAMAENGAGPEELARSLARSRQRIVEFGTAAGFSRREINGFLTEVGLTPRVVRTTLKAQGFTDAQIEAMELRAAVRGLPREVLTRMRADGIPKTKGDIRDLQRQYDLTPRQVRTLAQLSDAAAKAGINNLQGLLRRLDGTTAKPKADLIDNASGAIAGIAGALASLNGRTATTYIRTVRLGTVGGALGGAMGSADGGFVPKTGLPYADRHPYLLADGEGVTTNRNGETDRFRDVIAGINRGLTRAQVKGMLADGGFVGRAGPKFTVPAAGLSDRDVARIARAVRDGAYAGASAGVPGAARHAARSEMAAQDAWEGGLLR